MKSVLLSARAADQSVEEVPIQGEGRALPWAVDSSSDPPPPQEELKDETEEPCIGHPEGQPAWPGGQQVALLCSGLMWP